MAKSSADRRTSARLLLRIADGAFASRLLGRVSAPGVRTRVLGVLRHLRRLDATLATALKQPVETLDAEVAMALRIGTFEVVELGVPAPVAGDASVRLVRELGKGRASGLVNAVMRRAPKNWGRFEESEDLGIRFSHPDWLCRRWHAAWGREVLEDSLTASQRPAPTWAWFRDEEHRDRVRDEGACLEGHPWVPDAWRADGSQLVPAIVAGQAYAQDPASQLVAHVATVLGGSGASLLDLCAAPGGKTARAAKFGEWAGIVASDQHLGRLRLARKLFVSMGVSVQSVAQNGLLPALSCPRWSVVLLDAPCTGTGTLRRHPELRWRLKPDDIGGRAELQRALIEQALGCVEPGGVLLYSTCSVEPEENEEHFSEMLAGFESVDLSSTLPEGTPGAVTLAGGVLLRPQELCDGFTMHAVRRVV